MSWIWLLLLVVAILVVLFALEGKSGGTGSIGFPYQRGKPLFSTAERSFLGVLDKAVGPDYRAFAKVRLRMLLRSNPA